MRIYVQSWLLRSVITLIGIVGGVSAASAQMPLSGVSVRLSPAARLASAPITPAAQDPVEQANRLGWTQPVPSAEELALLSFRIEVDGTAAPLAGVSCAMGTVSGQAECSAPFPALTPGRHVIRLMAIRTEGTLVLEGPYSVPFEVRLVVAPGQPFGLRVIR